MSPSRACIGRCSNVLGFPGESDSQLTSEIISLNKISPSLPRQKYLESLKITAVVGLSLCRRQRVKWRDSFLYNFFYICFICVWNTYLYFFFVRVVVGCSFLSDRFILCSIQLFYGVFNVLPMCDTELENMLTSVL